MNYDFPYIRTLDDLLPAIEGRPEFVVAEKVGYTVVNYNVCFADTFPSTREHDYVDQALLSNDIGRQIMHAKLRRECRGIIFNTASRLIIRRPYHKFFNVGERAETLPSSISLAQPNEILEKLDGSMIAPFMVDDQMIWGTKMGATDVAKPVEEFVVLHPKYIRFAKKLLEDNLTPIFEWCSRKQRIVLDYPEDRLILTAIRHMNIGEYVERSSMLDMAVDWGIPYVQAFDGQVDIHSFIAYVEQLSDLEGFVVRFHDGHMVKTKCSWYVQIHKAKEAILQDRNIVQLILDNTIDDIKAHLLVEDCARMVEFEEKLRDKILYQTSKISEIIRFIQESKMERKTYALEYSQNNDAFVKQIVFRLWDDGKAAESDVYEQVCNTIRNNLNSNTKYDILKNIWLDGIAYNA